MKRIKTLFSAALVLVCCSLEAQESSSPNAASGIPKAYPEHLKWWTDARFGMFIHWGPVSLSGQEIGWARGAQIPIAEYDQLYTKFNPTNFNPDAWVKTAKDAGMKYMVLTTKHHDGFCLWNTKQTDHNIMRSPFGRDVVKELSAACKKQGIRFCTYYSTCDWHHPDFPLTSPGGTVKRDTSDIDRYERYLRAQVQELITGYGPLGLIWFDVPQRFDVARGQGVIDFARSLQPDLIVNNRSGAPGDYDTPEQQVGKYQDGRPWETCMTICTQWAWKPDDEMKSLKQCLQTLVACAGGDGNLLFNVGPTADGVIEARQVERLKEMGSWLSKYGESIYGTRGGPFRPGSYGSSTRKGNKIYVHVTDWSDDAIKLPSIPAKVLSCRALGGGHATVRQTEKGLEISVPEADRDPVDTVVVMELATSALEIAAVEVPLPGSLTTKAKAIASNIFQNRADYGADKAVDGLSDTRWATDAGTKSAWLEVDLGKVVSFTRARISEAVASRVQKFELQRLDGSDWKKFLTGKKIGESWSQRFAPITARKVRLQILEATDGPTIWEFTLLE